MLVRECQLALGHIPKDDLCRRSPFPLLVSKPIGGVTHKPEFAAEILRRPQSHLEPRAFQVIETVHGVIRPETDILETVEGGEDIIIQTTYKQRVIDYLAQHTDNPTLRKIQDFEQLTSGDFAELERVFFEELGTREEYNELAEGHPYKNNVAAFIRVINGIDRKKALQIYQNFIEDNNLTSEQELYLKNILDYVSVNGDIETRNFMEYPLKALNWRPTFGNNFVKLKDFVNQIHKVISMTA